MADTEPIVTTATVIQEPSLPAPPRFGPPGAKRHPAGTLARSMIWIYGDPKIGKTTLMSKFPGVWPLATEQGHEWVSIRPPTVITSWNEFIEFCVWIQTNQPRVFADGSPIYFLAIDTVDNLFKMCHDQVCSELGVQDPGEIPHGGGWGQLSKEFDRVMTKVRRWPYGLICISHARQKEFKTRGRKVDRYEPNIGAAGMRWCSGAADLILYAHSDEKPVVNEKNEITGQIREERLLLCHPQSWCVAGGRMSDRLPVTIPLSYDALIKYFPDTPVEEGEKEEEGKKELPQS